MRYIEFERLVSPQRLVRYKASCNNNRVAHHEPICFGIGDTISTAYARSHFQEILNIVTYMNINSQQLFYGVDGVLKEAHFIDNI